MTEHALHGVCDHASTRLPKVLDTLCRLCGTACSEIRAESTRKEDKNVWDILIGVLLITASHRMHAQLAEQESSSCSVRCFNLSVIEDISNQGREHYSASQDASAIKLSHEIEAKVASLTISSLSRSPNYEMSRTSTSHSGGRSTIFQSLRSMPVSQAVRTAHRFLSGGLIILCCHFTHYI